MVLVEWRSWRTEEAIVVATMPMLERVPICGFFRFVPYVDPIQMRNMRANTHTRARHVKR